MHRTPTYGSWAAMKERCTRPQHRFWKHYGGRGIKVCKRWQKFENFLADMGVRPDGMTLDRINPEGNYTPKNCRWADRYTQRRNRRK
jgi:hypothetical protein